MPPSYCSLILIGQKDGFSGAKKAIRRKRSPYVLVLCPTEHEQKARSSRPRSRSRAKKKEEERG